jgi:hypothetical protein
MCFLQSLQPTTESREILTVAVTSYMLQGGGYIRMGNRTPFREVDVNIPGVRTLKEQWSSISASTESATCSVKITFKKLHQ